MLSQPLGYIIIVEFVVESEMDENATPGKKLEDLIHLAELCVDLLQQNNENYAEVCSCSFYLYTNL